jgi:hypothetical protein
MRPTPCEIHVHEVHARKVHASEIHAYKVYGREMHAHEKYTYMRRTPKRYTTMKCTPMRYMPYEVYAYPIRRHVTPLPCHLTYEHLQRAPA